MATVLIAASPARDHVEPLLAVAADLVCRGHRVTVMTATGHSGAVRAAGAEARPLPPVGDLGAAASACDVLLVDCALLPRLPRTPGRTTVLGHAAGSTAVLGHAPGSTAVLGYAPNPFTAPLEVPAGVDRLILPTVPRFDRTRGDPPSAVRFVGLVRRLPAHVAKPVSWPVHRPVVGVTATPAQLAATTVAALADQDVTLVIGNGGPPDGLRAKTSAEARAAGPVPIEELLPFLDVLVTAGDYGTVAQGLAAGIPLVVTADTDGARAVAARVADTGAGIALPTGTPTALRAAVRRVLDTGSYLQQARRFEAAFARTDGLAEIAALVDEVLAERPHTAKVQPGSSAR